MAPHGTDPAALLGLAWRNRRDGRPIAVTTGRRPRPGAVRLQTVADVVRDHLAHPEAKSGDPRGGPGRRGSRGLLPRLAVRATAVAHIGKESNRLGEVGDGLVDDPDDVYVEYRDERREWEAAVPRLRRLRGERGWRYLAEASGCRSPSADILLRLASAGRAPALEPGRHLRTALSTTPLRGLTAAADQRILI
jgi:hypothetical protein